MFIGTKIKDLRKTQKMTLTELSQKSGVQLATLSRIEHMKMVGTLDSHIQIAKALRVDVTVLYSEFKNDARPIEVETPESLTDQFQHNNKSSYEILTKKVLAKKMMPVLVKLDPDGETAVEQGVIGSEKFLFVLEGKIEVSINDQMYILEKSHTLYFDAALPHCIKNSGGSPARVLSVSTPVSL